MVSAGARKFSDCPISHSMAHHLYATAHLLARHGYARVSDIARELDLTRGSVSVSMKGLCADGYVTQDENRFFQLTETGRRTVRGLRIRYEVMKHFFRHSLGMEEESAHQQSCRIAYLVTPETARRLATKLASRREEALVSAPAPSRLCPFGGVACDQPGPAKDVNATCGIECLNQWLPAEYTTLPCKVEAHAP